MSTVGKGEVGHQREGSRNTVTKEGQNGRGKVMKSQAIRMEGRKRGCLEKRVRSRRPQSGRRGKVGTGGTERRRDQRVFLQEGQGKPAGGRGNIMTRPVENALEALRGKKG